MSPELINAVAGAVRDTGGPLVLALAVLYLLYKQMLIMEKIGNKVDACHDDVLRLSGRDRERKNANGFSPQTDPPATR